VIQIEHVRAHLKDLSAGIVLSSRFYVTWACGLLPNLAKVPYFQYRAWWYSIVQKFHADDETNTGQRPWSGQSLKILIYGMMVLHRSEILCWFKKIILRFKYFSCPVNWSTAKKCAPYFRGNMEFPIYSISIFECFKFVSKIEIEPTL
jgi:hypothetical protein